MHKISYGRNEQNLVVPDTDQFSVRSRWRLTNHKLGFGGLARAVAFARALDEIAVHVKVQRGRFAPTNIAITDRSSSARHHGAHFCRHDTTDLVPVEPELI